MSYVSVIDINEFYKFGKILGIGTFGLIREAINVNHSFSAFSDPEFSVKTLKKSQMNVEQHVVPNEIINLVRI